MLLTGLDFETTNLLTPTTRPVQVACITVDTDTFHVVEAYETLIYRSDYEESSKEAFDTHKIPLEILQKRGKSPIEVFAIIAHTISNTDVICAHNGYGFDFPLLEQEFIRYGMTLPPKQRIDTKKDIKYPSKFRAFSLRHLAVDHGLIVDTTLLHGASYDVSLMLRILKNYDVNQVIVRANSPDIKVIALVPRELNHLVKEKQFRWEPESKTWWKSVKACDLPSFLESCKFPTKLEKTGNEIQGKS